MKERIEELAAALYVTDCEPKYIRQTITTAVNEALEMAAKECDNEHVYYEATQEECDRAYNQACDHCSAAIRKLKV